jgi:uncharacterized damage-inducible protein DinB
MSDPTADPTLDRLLRHMAWANAALFARLCELPDEALALAAPRNEWSMAMIVAHMVDAADGYAGRLDGEAFAPAWMPPTTIAELAALADACVSYDARLRAAGAIPEGTVQFGSGRTPRARSTILGQAIHHATEHRAQIAGALATNGIDAIDLDALDLWAYGDAEGLGAY